MTSETLIPPSLTRKIKRERYVRAETGLPQMGTVHYLEWLEKLHIKLKPEQYFEIGTERGASLSLAKCACIAVDPKFKIDPGVLGTKPEVHLFQQTSDDFFKSGFLRKRGKPIDLAFLDGMHKVEYLLRDFINTEKAMAADGVVLLHDCIPMSAAAAEREWDRSKTRGWTGDVWKMIPILKEFRPDLKVSTLDLAPTGIVIIENLKPKSKVLETNYRHITEKFIPLTIKEYGLDKFSRDLNLKPVVAPATVKKKDPWEMPSTPNPNMLRIAIKSPMAQHRNTGKIVDFAFARGIADGLLKNGHAIRIDPGSEWYSDTKGTDFDLVMRGRGGFEAQPNIPMISWVIYPGQKKWQQIKRLEIKKNEHVFFASILELEKFRQLGFGEKSSLLMQGFDEKIMYPSTALYKQRSRITLVGSNHFKKEELRPIVSMAVNSNTDLWICGRGWHRTSAAKYVKDTYLETAQVGELYRNSKIVLCDHFDMMREGGYVSNRIFDALACGAAVISDKI
tara:strand:+ start:2409 stop:3929 length:1521 start_codon:yes stop_codon:yes gene_type:complete